ncbi:DUF1799 domain-containing protein [Photobacterium profundum]|uniref:Phage protein n=1 Tax=Photobacterium profundum (strain SS9) TaxID=298386 RepID=Q6LHT1_PHOPR|nr:DUF1799 domain-containing protein [Photobacterium profundum]CAG23149.1 hypothetical protein PBPRB1278 [Photobacterium profundum SS9]
MAGDSVATDAALHRLGMAIEDFSLDVNGDDIAVWPENWPVVQLFNRMATQWRCGPQGVVGLDYNTIFTWMALEGWDIEVKRDVFTGLRVIEKRVLESINEVS